jgi:hypothetical protein
MNQPFYYNPLTQIGSFDSAPWRKQGGDASMGHSQDQDESRHAHRSAVVGVMSSHVDESSVHHVGSRRDTQMEMLDNGTAHNSNSIQDAALPSAGMGSSADVYTSSSSLRAGESERGAQKRAAEVSTLSYNDDNSAVCAPRSETGEGYVSNKRACMQSERQQAHDEHLHRNEHAIQQRHGDDDADSYAVRSPRMRQSDMQARNEHVHRNKHPIHTESHIAASNAVRSPRMRLSGIQSFEDIVGTRAEQEHDGGLYSTAPVDVQAPRAPAPACTNNQGQCDDDNDYVASYHGASPGQGFHVSQESCKEVCSNAWGDYGVMQRDVAASTSAGWPSQQQQTTNIKSSGDQGQVGGGISRGCRQQMAGVRGEHASQVQHGAQQRPHLHADSAHAVGSCQNAQQHEPLHAASNGHSGQKGLLAKAQRDRSAHPPALNASNANGTRHSANHGHGGSRALNRNGRQRDVEEVQDSQDDGGHDDDDVDTHSSSQVRREQASVVAEGGAQVNRDDVICLDD